MEKKIPDELLILHEELLKAQLQAIRRLRGPEAAERAPREGRSHMAVVIDLLKSEGKPLHISEIIGLARERFDLVLDRESLVSALVKKVKVGVLQRTAPNTFGVVK